MDEQQENGKKPRLYRVASIEKTEPPEENSGTEWYRYTIEHETTNINGKRSGSLRSVTQYLEEFVEKLNARPYLGFSSYAAKKGKK